MTITENDRWLGLELSDADLDDLSNRTRSGILRTREVAGWRYVAYVTTVDGYGEKTLDVLPHVNVAGQDDDQETQLDSVYGAEPCISIPWLGEDMDLDAALSDFGWERVDREWANVETGACAEVKRVDRGGRPFIGPQVRVSMSRGMLEMVEAYASRQKIKRPEAIRILVAKGLEAVDPWTAKSEA